MVPFLKKERIIHLDAVFISHPHKDHYEGLKAVLVSGIRISEVYFNLPNKEICDAEIPWGCDYQQVLAYHELLKKYGIPVKEASAGMKFDFGNGSMLSILYAFDAINNPVGRLDINDVSLIMLLEQDEYKILFTGDLNNKVGSYLAETVTGLDVDILKAPHHGTEGCAPNTFFEKVNPEIVMVPSPAGLWCSERSARMRNWFDNHKVVTYVNGFSGNTTVTIRDKKNEIFEELTGGARCK